LGWTRREVTTKNVLTSVRNAARKAVKDIRASPETAHAFNCKCSGFDFRWAQANETRREGPVAKAKWRPLPPVENPGSQPSNAVISTQDSLKMWSQVKWGMRGQPETAVTKAQDFSATRKRLHFNNLTE